MLVAISSNCFYTVTLPVTLWFLDNAKAGTPREDTVLFLDTSKVQTPAYAFIRHVDQWQVALRLVVPIQGRW